MSLLFFAVGAGRLALGALPLFAPQLSTFTVRCDPCVFDADPVMLIEPESVRHQIRDAPSRVAELNAHIAQPRVKILLGLSSMLTAIPFFVVFVGMAMALRHLAAVGFNASAIRWIRRAALAALVWTVAQPVSASIRWTALSEITHGRTLRHINLDFTSLVFGIIVSGAVWLLVWALEEALEMRRDLEEYV